MANSMEPEQAAPLGAVSSGSMLFVSILNLSIMLGNDLQQTTSADVIFRCIFFLGALRVNCFKSMPCPIVMIREKQHYLQVAMFIQKMLTSSCFSRKVSVNLHQPAGLM